MIQIMAPSSIQESNSAHEISVSGKGSYKINKEIENDDQNTMSLLVPKRPPVPGGMVKSRSSPTRKSIKDHEHNGR